MILFLVVAGGIGLLIGWLVTRGEDAKVLPVPAGPTVPPVASQVAPPPEPRPHPAPIVAPPEENTMAEAPPADDAAQGTWENKLEHILLADDDDNAKADHILELIPTAPPDAQTELAQHLVNMVQDDHYAGAAGLLTNSATPSAVSTVLMNDLLNRDNNLKLPMLLDVARQDDHPLKDQAREMLEVLLQEDHGTNWDDWSSSITTWLAQNQ
ncbi:MAG TPA: hypothetical protein VHB20_16860 [Verrucomicrobiae bacterium]|nr:hypothetical protein [Verrucomicrobiae bacterium]